MSSYSSSSGNNANNNEQEDETSLVINFEEDYTDGDNSSTGNTSLFDHSSKRSDLVLHSTIDEDAEYASGGFSLPVDPPPPITYVPASGGNRRHSGPFVSLPTTTATNLSKRQGGDIVVGEGGAHESSSSSGASSSGHRKSFRELTKVIRGKDHGKSSSTISTADGGGGYSGISSSSLITSSSNNNFNNNSSHMRRQYSGSVQSSTSTLTKQLGSGRRLSAVPDAASHAEAMANQTPKQKRVQEALRKQGKSLNSIMSTGSNKKSPTSNTSSNTNNTVKSSRRKVSSSIAAGSSNHMNNSNHNPLGLSQSTDSEHDVTELNRPNLAAGASKRSGGKLLGFSMLRRGNSTHPQSFLKSKLGRRTRLVNKTNQPDPISTSQSNRETTLTNRRYKPGEYVLVRNAQSLFANLVNRYGYPPEYSGEGGETAEELRGPYIYVLARVKQMHFEEIHPYYTVTRCDTDADQRADVDFMQPLRSGKGQAAALRAATTSRSLDSRGMLRGGDYGDEYSMSQRPDAVAVRTETGGGGVLATLWFWLQNVCYYMLLPILWLFDGMHLAWATFVAGRIGSCWNYVKTRAKLFLYGREPFICRARLTAVNFVVVCSTWFLFIDQARLAFFPPSSDLILARVNFGAWCVLVCELLFEVFIRPNGYQELIISDKAYAPTTVRYINGFHLFVETLSLGLFVPEFCCIFLEGSCGKRVQFSFYNAIVIGTLGPTRKDVFFGHVFIALIRLRVFGLVRHWKNMWITNTFISYKWKSKQTGMLSNIVPPSNSKSFSDRSSLQDKKPGEKERKQKDEALTNASNIGTALMSTNSYRALAIVWAIVGLFPVVVSFSLMNPAAQQLTKQLEATNLVASDTSAETCSYLESSIGAWLVGISNRAFLDEGEPYLMTVSIMPYRCSFDGSSYANVQMCKTVNQTHGGDLPSNVNAICDPWSAYADQTYLSIEEVAQISDIREGSVIEYKSSSNATFTEIDGNGGSVAFDDTPFAVVARFNQSFSVRTAARASLLLQICLLGTILGGLSILRRDAEVLVLGPLRRMLKIVARYARNPLVTPKIKRRASQRVRKLLSRVSASEESDTSSDYDFSDDDDENAEQALGSFETEQLITAVAKITDLLRKCWGVAGADIISTNLATREGALAEVFNPTVPGKSVYALFAFAAIGGFENALRNLGGDVMPLINDVAAVLHGEVFRWGFGDSGQCNKNLGGAFLMVFRIGLVKEVIEKLEQASDLVFSKSSGKREKVSSAARRRLNHRRTSSLRSANDAGKLGNASNHGQVFPARSPTASRKTQPSRSTKEREAMSLSLQSLPGIGTFTDRAVIGMLKSYAGIFRDRKVLNWNNDFRLGAGVGAFNISMIFGMDAGWAVEGAVGSEYKIDATYLSPHVNMASRMTSACKQYDVSIMLSQAVQELMTDVAQSKLRHLDTVTVKGSSVKQKIFTYDARARGVDFFLHSRSEEQADYEADRYSTSSWTTDQDLLAMRQHVTEDFLKAFERGHKAYSAGDWPTAIEKLELANDIMFQTAVDEGYLEDEFDALNLRPGEDVRGVGEELKRDYGDGPSMYLINFMNSLGGVAPKDWAGWHPLTRK